KQDDADGWCSQIRSTLDVMKNSFRGVFHCRKTKAWFCFAREFNGLRHRIRRYIHVPQGSSD
ncbi:MAG: hypothetical protein OXE54_03675, partial [Gammaproteobacteria bacterium]|nr:hypothetical protein [Gammaproteobacteria bacterium]